MTAKKVSIELDFSNAAKSIANLIDRAKNIDLNTHGHKIVGLTTAMTSFVVNYSDLFLLQSALTALATGSVTSTVTKLFTDPTTQNKNDNKILSALAAAATVAFTGWATHSLMSEGAKSVNVYNGETVSQSTRFYESDKNHLHQIGLTTAPA